MHSGCFVRLPAGGRPLRSLCGPSARCREGPVLAGPGPRRSRLGRGDRVLWRCGATAEGRNTVPSTVDAPSAGDTAPRDNAAVELGSGQVETGPLRNPLDQASKQEGAPASLQDEQTWGSILLLISPFFFWGTSMACMKALTPHTAPLWVSAVRLLPAGALVVAWAAAQRRPQPKGAMAWLAISIFAVVDGACFQGFLAEGLQRTSAGLGSVIIDSQPLTVALLASIFFGERLGRTGIAGLLVGVLGLCLLEVPPELLTALPALLSGKDSNVVASSTGWSLWDSGEWWMLLAAQSMAVGTVLVPWVTRFVDPVMATGYHMILGGMPLLALSVAKEGPVLADHLPQLTGLDWTLLFYISAFGSAASYGVFFFNAAQGNLTTLSSLTFLTPVFAAASGFVFLGEALTPLQYFGAAVTLGAVYLIHTRPEKTRG